VGTRASLIIFSFCFLVGCAGNQSAVSSSEEYVEIENPAFTMSGSAPPTIWVPRRYVDSGIPRGGELLEKGYESVRGKLSDSGQQPAPRAPEPAPVSAQASVPAPVSAPVPVSAPSPVSPPVPSAVAAPAPIPAKTIVAPSFRNRILVIETGNNVLSARFGEALKQASAGTVIDPAQAAFVTRYAALGTPAERAALAVKLQEDFGAGLVIYLAAPDGTAPGKTITAEMHEGQGGTLLRKLDALIPAQGATGTASREAVIATALRGLASEVKGVAALAPWYGKVVTVEGERIYINAGKETGISLGQMLNLYRSGKVVEKLGFAPGLKVGILEITGFVGTDGAYGIVRQGGKAQPSDLVGIE
jgi:hypothetical protein